MNNYDVRWRELLTVFDEEQLIRFAYRLRKKGYHESAQLLDEEIANREKHEQAQT